MNAERRGNYSVLPVIRMESWQMTRAVLQAAGDEVAERRPGLTMTDALKGFKPAPVWETRHTK